MVLYVHVQHIIVPRYRALSGTPLLVFPLPIPSPLACVDGLASFCPRLHTRQNARHSLFFFKNFRVSQLAQRSRSGNDVVAAFHQMAAPSAATLTVMYSICIAACCSRSLSGDGRDPSDIPCLVRQHLMRLSDGHDRSLRTPFRPCVRRQTH